MRCKLLLLLLLLLPQERGGQGPTPAKLSPRAEESITPISLTIYSCVPHGVALRFLVAVANKQDTVGRSWYRYGTGRLWGVYVVWYRHVDSLVACFFMGNVGGGVEMCVPV